MYKVFIKTNDNDCIVAINSSAFIEPSDGWVEIDSGYSDKYHHAQNNYLDKSLSDERGVYRYVTVPVTNKLEREVLHEYLYNNVLFCIYEKTLSEMEADYVELEQKPSQLDVIEAQVTYTAMMTDTLLEV